MAYVAMWENRCYFDGIPDEVSNNLMKSGRVPSYKAIALAILKNDTTLRSLGFSGKDTDWYGVLKKIEFKKESCQIDLFY